MGVAQTKTNKKMIESNKETGTNFEILRGLIFYEYMMGVVKY